MTIVFTPQSWEDYLYWQKADEKLLEKINTLIKDCIRNHFKGLGKPEPLKGDLKGFWSRRIDHEHRLVYRIEGTQLQIVQCRYHYR
jgi:toxin YoeB